MAVARKQTRGARPVTPASSTAYRVSGPTSQLRRSDSAKPPEVARMVGDAAVTGGRYCTSDPTAGRRRGSPSPRSDGVGDHGCEPRIQVPVTPVAAAVLAAP